MMEMKIKIDVPELVAAVEKLAAAIDKTALNITVPNEGTLNFNMPAGNSPVAPAPTRHASISIIPAATGVPSASPVISDASFVTVPTISVGSVASFGNASYNSGIPYKSISSLE